MKNYCSNCGFKNENEYSFCPDCGQSLMDSDFNEDVEFSNDSNDKDLNLNADSKNSDSNDNDRNTNADSKNSDSNDNDSNPNADSNNNESKDNKSSVDSDYKDDTSDLNLIEQIEYNIKEKYIDSIEIDLSKKEEKENEFMDNILDKRNEIENILTNPIYDSEKVNREYSQNQSTNRTKKGHSSSSKYLNEKINKRDKNKFIPSVLDDKRLNFLDDMESEIKNAVINKKDSLTHRKEDLIYITEQFSKGMLSFNIEDSSIILKKDEKILLDMDRITLKEAKAVRVSNNNRLGGTVKLSKKAYLHLGGGQSKSISHDELKDIDSGNLIITNQRLIFKGSLKTRNIALSNILAIDHFKEGVAIQLENRQNIEYFYGTDKSKLSFTVEGRKHSTPLYGYIIKAAIIGQINNLQP